MIKVHNDPKLKEWGFKLILTIHDELMGECPKENALKCGKRLSHIMIKTAEEALDNFPFKSDPETCEVWYGTTITDEELIAAYGDIDESEVFADVI